MEMKRIFHIILTILALIGLFSCEKVIYIDLNEADPQIVIEGIVLNDDESYVKLSKTGSYYQAVDFETISNAYVTVEDEAGNSFIFTESEAGHYINDSFSGNTEQVYHLKVTVDDLDISSTSTMPKLIPIDSLTYEIEAGRLGFREGMTIKCHYTDPSNVDNFYLLKFYQNGEKVSGFEVKSDRIDDGNATYYSYRLEDYQYGDVIDVKFYSIDEANYEYFNLNSNGGGMRQSAAPGNPESNLIGEAIGIFGAYALSKSTVVLIE